ncbi:MAG: autotransporter outer membrane beta-barrel domain-containing protein [Schwartzia succinivorans]|uniref:hypothetical protein n=1 Tax=Schwartzia succinivorans TaxID=55507 RepID=UPI0023521C1C|nr:hypothetical protein [Schwartzia succinivorans]MBE6096864.1 autotransporter outer membrane beta-barrel domain-containing protein [Schwartzia succinivorans]
MSRKERERERKLTSLILTGLMLSNGMFLTPMAEAAGTYTVTENGLDNTGGAMKYESNSLSPKDATTVAYSSSNIIYFNDVSQAHVGSIYAGSVSSGIVQNNEVYYRAGLLNQVLGGKDAPSINNCKVYLQGGLVNSGDGLYARGVYAAKGGYYTTSVSNNEVHIQKGNLANTTICGGYNNKGSVTGNKVYIRNETGAQASYNGTVNLDGAVIYGGQYKYSESENTNQVSSTNNLVSIEKSVTGTIKGIVVGQGTTSTGNTLSLGIKGLTIGTNGVTYTQKVELQSGIVFKSGDVVLNTPKLSSDGGTTRLTELDISNWNVSDDTATGTMTILRSSGTNFTGLKVTHAGGTINSLSTTPQTIKDIGTPTSEQRSDVDFTYQRRHSMLLANSNHDVNYKIHDYVSKVTLGTIAWDSSTPARTVAANTFTFDSDTEIDSSGLTFTGTVDGQSMTLLSGASEIKTDSVVKDYNLAANITDANGVSWVGTATKGNLVSSSSDGTVKYNITEGTVSSINLGGWSSGSSLSFLTGGWSGTDIAVNTGSFTASPTEGTFLSSTNGSTFGTVSGARAYKEGAFDGDTVKGVTLSGTQVGGVKVNDTDNTKLDYVAENKQATGISLGNVTWDDGRAATSAYDFTGVTGVDASNLNVSFTGTDANTVGNGSKTTLLSNAKNLDGNLPATGTPDSQSISYTDTAKGVKLSGTMTGTVSTSATAGVGKVEYTVTGKTLENVDLSNWNGTAVGNIDTSWEPGTTTGIAVDTGNFDTPTTGGDVDIFTLDPTGSLVFGEVTGDKAYSEGGSFSGDEKNGVTLSGTKSGGIKKSDDSKTLTYKAETKNAKNIDLGGMTWGTGRAAETNYDFGGVTSVNANNLSFDIDNATVNTISKDTEKWSLLSGAKNLGGNLPVSGTPHSQTVSYTDSTQGIKLTGTLTGDVSTSSTGTTGTVDYKVTGKSLDKLDLTGWKGSGVTIDSSWGPSTSGGGIDVDAGVFTTTPSTDTTIMTLTGDGLEFGNVTGTKAYKDNERVSGDEDEGVTLSGMKSGGVKVDDTDKKKLLYKAEHTKVDKVDLGGMTWGTSRAMSAAYDFSNVGNGGIDASKLTFTFDNDTINSLNPGTSGTTLISNATGLGDGLTVTGSPRSQSVGYNAANGVTIGGTVTGNVTTESEEVKYSVTGKSVDSVNISNWDYNGTPYNVSTNHWTKNTGGISVTGSGFTQPPTGAVADYTILLSDTDDFFKDAKIDDSIKYKPSGTYSETDSGITLSGQQAKGVIASDDGQSLIYRVGAASISSIVLGSAVYTKDGVYLDKSGAFYDYSNVSTLNTNSFSISMTQDQKKGAAVGDSMTLLKGNGTLNDIAGKEAGANNYSYEKAAGLSVDGKVTGNVSASGGNVLYTVADNSAMGLNFSTVGWGSGYTREGTEVFTKAVVDASNITFSGMDSLSAGDEMELVSNFGDSVNKTRGGVFTLSNGKTGKGHAYWKEGKLYYVVDRGTDEAPAADKDAIKEGDDVSGGEKKGDVTGGEATGNGTAKENETTVENGAKIKTNDDGTGGDVIGGKSDNGPSTGNTANVKGGSEVEGDVKGGHSDGGNTTGNIASVTGGSKVGGDVTGGSSTNGTSVQNTANVSGSEVDGNIYGGKGGGNVTSNTASVTNSDVKGNVYGGKSSSGEASSNTAEVTGGTVDGAVYGGYSETGTASNNTVTARNVNIRDYLYGGKSKIRSSEDSVNFEDGTVLGIIGGGCAEAVNNTVTVANGTVQEHAFGAFAEETATGNIVTVTGGTINGSVIGGYGGTTAADSNTVNLSGGTVLGNTFASSTLGGLTIDGGVYGGYSESGTTKNNTVNLSGTADISSTGLFGGNREYTGNILNVGAASAWTGGGQSVKNIANFETVNFKAAPWSTSKAAVTISDGTASDLSHATVSASNIAFSGATKVSKGDTMTLLDQSSAASKAATVTEASEYTMGTALTGTGKVTKDATTGNVLYEIESVGLSEQTHNTVMASEAGMVAINAGNDFINSATERMFRKENIGADGVYSYAKLGGSSIEQETGSHVNVNMWNGIVSVGKKSEKENSTIDYGAFVEHGKGSFTTHNGAERGDGKVDYTGGGLLGRITNKDGLYYEGSIRVGSVREDTSNLLRAGDQTYGYNERSNYLGFHLGVGKQVAVKNGDTVEVYGRYFFNHKNGIDFTADGDKYDLDAVNSHILRAGARYTMKRDKWNFYGDLSYEHEFDGKAEGSVNGMTIRGADTSGGSARLELGATFKESADSPWSLSLDMTGYAGHKKGFKGGVSMNFAF